MIGSSHRESGTRWRSALALPAGVLAVHQLRYGLSYGAGAGRALRAHGDTYVASAVPMVSLLLAAASLLALVGLARACRGQARPHAHHRPWAVWASTTLVLLAGFCALELLESALESTHPAVLSMFGAGGWWSIPASAAVAALFTLIVLGGRALLVLAAGGRAGVRCRASALGQCFRVWLPRRPVLAAGAAGRAPPSRRLPGLLAASR